MIFDYKHRLWTLYITATLTAVFVTFSKLIFTHLWQIIHVYNYLNSLLFIIHNIISIKSYLEKYL